MQWRCKLRRPNAEPCIFFFFNHYRVKEQGDEETKAKEMAVLILGDNIPKAEQTGFREEAKVCIHIFPRHKGNDPTYCLSFNTFR